MSNPNTEIRHREILGKLDSINDWLKRIHKLLAKQSGEPAQEQGE